MVTSSIATDAWLKVEGRIVGDAICSALVIGEKGAFAGRIYLDWVQVRGEIEGAIRANDLAVESPARIIADVTYPHLRVASGGSKANLQVDRRKRGTCA